MDLKLYLLLKVNTLSIDQLKIILDTNNINKIIYTLLDSIKQFILNPDYKSSYLKNLKLVFTEINNNYDINVKRALEIIQKYNHMLSKIKLENKKYMLRYLDDIANIFLTKKTSDTFNEYDFMNTLIMDIKSIPYIKHILNMYPHYTNCKDKEGKHIILHLIDIFSSNYDSYLESIIMLFIANPKFNLKSEDLNYLANVLKEHPSRTNDHILSILLNNEITVENINFINEKYDIRPGFSNDVKKEIIPKKDYIITIDSESTLDMDDALSIKYENDIYQLKVYITDVASFIKPNTTLDMEAFRRCETLYMSDQNIHMLPAELSNDLLSLNNKSYKKVYVFNINIDKYGNIIDFKISKDSILVDKKLSYNKVNEYLKNGTYNELEKTLINLSDVAYLLRSKNKQKETYRKIEDLQKINVFNKKNKYELRTASEIIVEESMILINHLTAKLFSINNYPFIYRNHLEPESSLEYQKILSFKNNFNLENKYIEMLDSLSKLYPKADYSNTNKGHFGLNLDSYSHVSSPIRRYPDIIAQRLIDDYIFGIPNSEKDKYWCDKIKYVCRYANERMEKDLEYQKEYERVKVFLK